MNDDKNMRNNAHDNVTGSEKPEKMSASEGAQNVNTDSEPKQNDRRSDSVSVQTLPSDANVLVRWHLLEETEAYSRDKIIFTVLVGAAATVFAIIAKTYVFAVLLVVATAFLCMSVVGDPAH